MTRSLVFVAALALGGCVAGPDYVAPTAKPSAVGGFIGGREPGVSAEPVPADWARLFRDPVLDGLIQDALRANADLRIAGANLRRATAAAREARAAKSPATTVRGAIDVDESTPDPTGATDTYDAAFDVAYQLDLAGKLRRASEATRADAEAEQATYEAVRITIAAETARAYVEACGATRRMAVARAAVDAQAHTADLVGRRVQEGAASGLNLAQARAQFEATKAMVPALVAERTAALYRLATLTGRAPAELSEDAIGCTTPPRVAAVIPIGDGATLIARRPDIRAAERRAAAASARIGVAKADLYPQIRLGLSAGAGGEESDDIGFKWSVAPLITWTFPNRSQVRARLDAAEAGAEGALAAWDKAVLTALQEVETALSHYARELDRNAALARAAAEADKAVQRAQIRYREGAESLLAVLDAERRKAEVEAELAASDQAVAAKQIALFLALGGGWS